MSQLTRIRPACSACAALVLAFCLSGCSKSHADGAGATASASASGANKPAEEALPPADASVTALLGLKAGDPIGPAHVDQVFGVSEGRIAIRVVSGGSLGWVEVTLRSEEPQPPVSTNRYSVYWTMRGQSTNRMPDEPMGQVCVAVGERLRAVEEQVPVPQGLKQFPKPQPQTL